MNRLPIFTQEEKANAAALVMSDQFDRRGKYVLILRGLTQPGLAWDKIASAYLLMNAILMTRARRKIAKFLVMEDGGVDHAHGIVNILRAHLRSDFSSLANVRQWEAELRAVVKLPDDIIKEVERTVEFFESSEIASSAASFQRAEVCFGFSVPEVTDPLGGEVRFFQRDIFSYQVETLSGARTISASEMFSGEANTYRLGHRGKNTIIELSLADWQQALQEWMDNVRNILDREFYSQALAAQ